MINREIKITIDELEISLKKTDINIKVEFDREITANICTVEVYNNNELSKKLYESNRKIIVEAGDLESVSVVFIGKYLEFDNYENRTDKKTILYCSTDPAILFEKLINKKYLNTDYSSIIKLIANDLGIDLGEIKIEKDVLFESNAIYKNLTSFMSEVKINTQSLCYLKENKIYATPTSGESEIIDIEETIVSRNDYIGNNRYKLTFRELVSEIEANVKININGEMYVIDKGIHFSSSKTGEHYTEVEALAIQSLH